MTAQPTIIRCKDCGHLWNGHYSAVLGWFVHLAGTIYENGCPDCGYTEFSVATEQEIEDDADRKENVP